MPTEPTASRPRPLRLPGSDVVEPAESILQARQRAEEALLSARDSLEKKSEALVFSLAMMRATLEASRDGILVTDEAGKVTEFNQQYVRMWQLAGDVMQTREHERLLALASTQVDEAQRFLERVREIDRSSPAESFDLLKLRDGRVYERSSKLQFVEGRKVGRVWVFRDISERRQAEDSLLEETRVLELLNQTGAVLTATLDIQALVQSVTDAATEISGAEFGAFFYQAGEGGKDFTLHALSGVSRASFEQRFQPRAQALFALTFSGAPPVRLDDVLQDPRYGPRAPPPGAPQAPVLVRSYLALPVASGSGEVMGGLFFGHREAGVFNERAERLVTGIAAQAGVAIDNARLYEVAGRSAQEREVLLANERAARSEAEHLSQMKDEFLAMLAHELRNPLAPLRSSVEILRRTAIDPAELEKARAIMERQITHMTRLVDDLLDISRISRGKLEMRLEKIELADALRSAAEASRPAISARAHEFRVNIPPQSVALTADLVRLSQALSNLLNNAAKYTPEGGLVELRAEVDSAGVSVSIEDNGTGVPEHLRNRIFDMFVQGEPSSSDSRVQGGLGIGLTLVRKIVEMHGGTVRAEGRDDGPGSKFTVWLPLGDTAAGAPAAPAALVAPAAEPAPAVFESRRILVVDDNADAALTLAQLLGIMGHEVRTAHDGASAIALAESFRPQIIFLDIGMPRMDGYEVCRRIRALEQQAATLLVALTGWGQADDKRKAQEAGFDHHFTKPVDPAQLEALVGSNF
jgi:PAS domain S-box-containing protein